MPDPRAVGPLIRQLQGVSKEPFPFAAGWADYGGGNEVASVSRHGRTVILQGGVTKTVGAPAAGNVIGTLAAAYWPAGTLWFSVPTGPAVTLPGVVRVDPNGDVIWWAGSATEPDFASLSGITYVVD